MKGCSKDRKDGKECGKDGKDKEETFFFQAGPSGKMMLDSSFIDIRFLCSENDFVNEANKEEVSTLIRSF